MSVTTEGFSNSRNNSALSAAADMSTGRAAAKLNAERDLPSMTFAEVLQRQEDLRDALALSQEELNAARNLRDSPTEGEIYRNALAVVSHDANRLSGFVDAVRDSQHSEYYAAHEAREQEVVMASLAVDSDSLQAGEALEISDSQMRELQRQVFNEAMAEMSQQLYERADIRSDLLRSEPTVLTADRVRQSNDLDRNGSADHLEYDGAEEMADAAYMQQQRDRAEHTLEGEAVASPAPARWTVQEYDSTKGVFVDVRSTDSALQAHEDMRQRGGSDARVIDNGINDFAAQWEKSHSRAPAEIRFHERSDFKSALESEAREELQQVIDKRADLQGKVDVAAESVAVAVDQVRDDSAPIDKVQQGYETAAIAYAQAKRDLQAVEAQPSSSPIVTEKFRTLQELEANAANARETAAHARIDGDKAASVESALTDSQAALAAFAAREGVRLPPASERTSNEIEAGLTPEQIKRLMEAPRREKASAELDDAAAIEAAKVPQIGTAHNEARDNSAFADGASRARVVPEEVAAAYKREGEKYLDLNDPKRVAFVDKGNRLQTVRTFDDKAVADMIQTADARGWSEIKVSGDEAFRRKAWIEAAARGIEVKGYEPSEKDKARAEELGRNTGRTNAIEENAAVKAYREARDGSPKDRTTAARQHPELVPAFALQAAAASFAKQRLNEASREGFMRSTMENIERDLAAGRPIPEVKRRQEKDRDRAPDLDAGR